jgi:endonuclease G
MLLNKLLTILSIFFLLMNCTSKSAQAKLRSKNTTPSSKIKKPKERIDDALNPSKFFLYPASTTNQIIKHKYYSISYSEEDEQAEWVAYKIISNRLQNIDRTNDFREDPNVSTGSSDLTDYIGSGYDRGHLAPAKTMSLNETSMSESFYMSNMSPQIPEFNRGIWKRLEGKVRYWAEVNDSLYVVTGPILSRPIDIIGDNDVTVPRAFYKALLGFKNGKIKGIAFIIPNQKSDKSIYSYAVSIDEIEKITQIDFYHNLDSLLQAKVEANKSIKVWLSTKK